MQPPTCKDCPRPVATPGAVRCARCTGAANARSIRATNVKAYLFYLECGFSADQARRQVGVTLRTVQRWRKLELIP
jgi:hypothetical protein